jgi:hypothetical protein
MGVPRRWLTDGREERGRDGKEMGEVGSGSARARADALKQSSNYTARGITTRATCTARSIPAVAPS